MRARLLVLLALPLLTQAAAAADPPATKGGAGEEKKYAPMPWHLVDVWWDLHESAPFESLAVDVTVGDDVPSSVNLYIAPIGLGHFGKTAFYGGLQTQADGNTRREPRLRTIGPGLLFSVWGERSLDAIRPPDGGFLQSSGHEGDFVSTRRPYAWTRGRYTYRLARMDREVRDGQPFTWVGAFLHNRDKDEHVFIGALRVPGDNLVLDRKVANFVEVYGRRRPVSDIPKVTVTFGPPVVNGRPAANPSAEAIYPRGVPDYAEAVAKGGSLVVTVGQPVPGRDKRRVLLIEGKKPTAPRD